MQSLGHHALAASSTGVRTVPWVSVRYCYEIAAEALCKHECEWRSCCTCVPLPQLAHPLAAY